MPRMPSADESAHPGGALPSARVTQAPQAPHEQRVKLERLLGVDETAKQLVVACRTHAQLRTDGLLLHAAVPRPGRLQRQDRAVAIGEFTEHGPRLRGAGRFTGAPLPPSAERIGI